MPDGTFQDCRRSSRFQASPDFDSSPYKKTSVSYKDEGSTSALPLYLPFPASPSHLLLSIWSSFCFLLDLSEISFCITVENRWHLLSFSEFSALLTEDNHQKHTQPFTYRPLSEVFPFWQPYSALRICSLLTATIALCLFLVNTVFIVFLCLSMDFVTFSNIHLFAYPDLCNFSLSIYALFLS